MSAQAPYVCLFVDWWESDQFDDASHGQRLAWIELLCFAKIAGEDGRIPDFDPIVFADARRLDPLDVADMLRAAIEDEAVHWEGKTLVLGNWLLYQPKRRPPRRDGALLYFMQNDDTGEIKIGVSIQPLIRRREIERREQAPIAILLVTEGGYALEKELHDRLAAHRTRGEWFAPCAEISEVMDELGAGHGR